MTMKAIVNGLCLTAVVAVLLVGLAFGALPAVAAPAASIGSPSLVVSEVYAPVGGDPRAQWFEIHNIQPKISYLLNGLIVATGGNQMPISTTEEIGGSGYVLFVFDPNAVAEGLVTPVDKTAPVISAAGLGHLDPQHDALILYTPDKFVIDEVNWGSPSRDWVNYNKDLWALGLDPLRAGEGSWGRTPEDRDTNGGHAPGGDWTKHASPSPGGKLPLVRGSNFLLGWTNWAGGVSNLLLWAAFIIIAVIAYGFERLRGVQTYWQLLLLAPSGILFYTVIVMIGFGQPLATLTTDQQWLAFTVLAISALFCLAGVGLFRNAARERAEGEQP